MRTAIHRDGPYFQRSRTNSWPINTVLSSQFQMLTWYGDLVLFTIPQWKLVAQVVILILNSQQYFFTKSTMPCDYPLSYFSPKSASIGWKHCEEAHFGSGTQPNNDNQCCINEWMIFFPVTAHCTLHEDVTLLALGFCWGSLAPLWLDTLPDINQWSWSRSEPSPSIGELHKIKMPDRYW